MTSNKDLTFFFKKDGSYRRKGHQQEDVLKRLRALYMSLSDLGVDFLLARRRSVTIYFINPVWIHIYFLYHNPVWIVEEIPSSSSSSP